MGKVILEELSDCTWRTEKLNLTSKEKFATIHLNSVVKHHKNTEISQRFSYIMPHVPGADSTTAQKHFNIHFTTYFPCQCAQANL